MRSGGLGPYTNRGVAVLVAGVCLLGAAWALAAVELAVLGLACLLVVGVASAFLAFRPKVRIEREIHPDRVPAGELALARVKVRNIGRRAAPAFTAWETFDGRLLEVEIPPLPAGNRKSTTYRIPTERRGVLPVGPVLIGRADPFGLVRTRREHGDVITLWVHPRHHALAPLPAARTRSLDGPTNDTSPHGSLTFHALREYVMGDDLRRVHWRSSARTGTLMVRQYVDTSLPDTTVVLDGRAAQHDDTSFETAMEVTASVVLACTGRHFPVRLLSTSGVDLSTRGGVNVAMEVLDTLAAADADDGDLDSVFAELSQTRGGSALVLVLAAPEPETLLRVAALARRFAVTVLVDTRPDPARPIPALRGVRVVSAPDGATFAAGWNTMARAGAMATAGR